MMYYEKSDNECFHAPPFTSQIDLIYGPLFARLGDLRKSGALPDSETIKVC